MATTRRSSSIGSGVLLALFMAAAGCVTQAGAPPSPPASPQPTAALPTAAPAVKTTADIVAAALPSIVLLINERPAKDARPAYTTYGAGFLTRDGLVVTSLHVVDGPGKLSAMLFRQGRPSYMPLDGGLPRFLFENNGDLVRAERVAADGVSDLAVVRIDADTSQLPKLVWSGDEVRPGDRVLALGHPQETVWSFSEGVVGALQYGIMQHDAIVGPGSSGGPLLNARGEVIGVNIARVANQPAGLSFARPITFVAKAFGDRKVTSPLDRTTPAAAALSCWRAQQLALPETADCFDWDHHWDQFRKSVEEARRLTTTSAARDKIDTCLLAPHVKDAWLAIERDHAVHVFDPEHHRKPDVQKPGAQKPELGPAQGEEPKKGLAADYWDPQRLATRLRHGMRADNTHFLSPDLAWVLLASRAADSTVDQLTELYVRIQGKWVQRIFPSADEIAALPAAWPRPMSSEAAMHTKQIAGILKKATSADPCPFAPPPSSSASSSGGAGRALLRPGFATDL